MGEDLCFLSTWNVTTRQDLHHVFSCLGVRCIHSLDQICICPAEYIRWVQKLHRKILQLDLLTYTFSLFVYLLQTHYLTHLHVFPAKHTKFPLLVKPYRQIRNKVKFTLISDIQNFCCFIFSKLVNPHLLWQTVMLGFHANIYPHSSSCWKKQIESDHLNTKTVAHGSSLLKISN